MKNTKISQEMTPATLKKYHSVFPDPDEKDRLCIRIEHGVFAGLGIASVSYTHLTLPTICRCRSRWSPYH